MKIAFFAFLCACFPFCMAMAIDETNFATEIFAKLLPDNEHCEVAVNHLKTLVTASSNRSEVVAFVTDRLHVDSLAEKDQVRLGIVVRALMLPPHTNDSETVKGLISQGRRFISFYGECLMELNPTYIELSFDVFTNKADIVASRFSFETQQMEDYVIQDEVLLNLKNATKRDFGRNRRAWQRWWSKEGKSLVYDSETGEYSASTTLRP